MIARAHALSAASAAAQAAFVASGGVVGWSFWFHPQRDQNGPAVMAAFLAKNRQVSPAAMFRHATRRGLFGGLRDWIVVPTPVHLACETFHFVFLRMMEIIDAQMLVAQLSDPGAPAFTRKTEVAPEVRPLSPVEVVEMTPADFCRVVPLAPAPSDPSIGNPVHAAEDAAVVRLFQRAIRENETSERNRQKAERNARKSRSGSPDGDEVA